MVISSHLIIRGILKVVDLGMENTTNSRVIGPTPDLFSATEFFLDEGRGLLPTSTVLTAVSNVQPEVEFLLNGIMIAGCRK